MAAVDQVCPGTHVDLHTYTDSKTWYCYYCFREIPIIRGIVADHLRVVFR